MRPDPRTLPGSRIIRTAVVGVLSVLLALSAAPAAAAAPPAAADTAASVLRGGQRLHSTGGSCLLSFNATRGGDFYGIMPGHCGNVGTRWFADSGLTVPVGVTEASQFPNGSHALVRYTNTGLSYPSEILAGSTVLRMNRAEQPVVGRQVCQAAASTGVLCGTITAVNQTIAYPDGTVTGLFRSNICSPPGYGGAPAFAGTGQGVALGFVVAVDGSCGSGGSTYYQPLTRVLEMYGLTIGH